MAWLRHSMFGYFGLKNRVQVIKRLQNSKGTAVQSEIIRVEYVGGPD